MIGEDLIQKISAMLAEAAGPSRIILFGSWARGEAVEGSDLDFLVVEPEVHHRLKEMTRLRQVVRPLRIPVDILVCSRMEMEERRHASSSAIHWALHEGRIVHDSLG